MNKCQDCKWWGRHLVGANGSKVNKKRAICDDPDQPSFYEFYVHGEDKKGWDTTVDFWTYEDFSCVSFKKKGEKNG